MNFGGFMRVSVFRSWLSDPNRVSQRMAYLSLTMLIGLGCHPGKGNDIDLSTGAAGASSTSSHSNTSASQSTQSTSSQSTQTSSSTGLSTGLTSGVLTSSHSSGQSSGSQGTGSSPDPSRDCAKIKWGDRLKEGEIISRGDVRGYMDADGDGLVEEKLRDVGMCQMHLSGKRCGLMVYGRWG